MESGPRPPTRPGPPEQAPGPPEEPPRRPEQPPGRPEQPPGTPVPRPPAPPSPYGGSVPPGGWHEPIPARPLPGELAGWWRRVGAALIDAVVVCVPAVVLLLAIVAVVTGAGGSIEISDEDVGVLVGILIVIGSILLVTTVVLVTAVVYAPLTMRREGRRNGQTWGKQLLDVRVVRMSGEPYTFGSAAVREAVVKTLLFGIAGGLLLYVPTVLDWLWPLWDDENRALHDMLVDSRVIRAAVD